MSLTTRPEELDEDAQVEDVVEAEMPEAANAVPGVDARLEPLSEMSPERRQRVEQAIEFAKAGATLCADLKCRDVRVLNVAGLSPVCDVLVLATGSSPRQMRTIGVQVEELGEEHGLSSIIGFKRSEANDAWIALDLVDVVVHVFNEESRSFYDLDGLWSDAEEIKWHGDASE